MRKLRLLILLGMFICSQTTGWSQVFGYPGATWLFHGHDPGPCFDIHEKWEYIGDTTVLGTSSKNLRVTRKTGVGFPPPAYSTTFFNRFFKVNGDTAWLFVNADSSWLEVYNFSLQIGDSTLNPLGNKLNTWASSCPDSVPYNDYSEVIDTGSTLIAGQTLRYYTVRYATGSQWGADSANHTFYERIITQNYWFPNDSYWCGAVPECGVPDLVCYKDNGMMTDSLCDDLAWFETLSIPEQSEQSNFKIYPNPATEILVIENGTGNLIYYDILSIDGKLITSSIQSPINVSHLPSGIYFITDGTRSWHKKFIKT